VAPSTTASQPTSTATTPVTLTATSAPTVISSSNPFRGSIQGLWQGLKPTKLPGTPLIPTTVPESGNISITVDSQGNIQGSFSGTSSGTLSGQVSSTGSLSMTGYSGGGSGQTFQGIISKSGNILSMTGTFTTINDWGGSFSGTGTSY